MKSIMGKYHWLLAIVVVCVSSCAALMSTSSSDTDKEIAELISKMTIVEKVGQMTQLNLDVVCVGEIYKLDEPHRLDKDKLHKALVDWHVGSILNCGGHAYPRDQWLEIIGEIQEVATKETRLKIPVLYGIDAIHGANYVSGSTLFPQQLAQAATFNPSLSKAAAEITAYETRAAGIPWNFSPVLDVGRNPLWSRFFETYGEDPLVCSRFGAATISGYQGKMTDGAVDQQHVAACMKHFLGYSASRTGKDRTPSYISEIQLREIYLPSFKTAIEKGALTVMINSGEINGIPVHADKKILTDLLRGELKFEGVAVTDWEDVIKLVANHRVAPTLKEAVAMSVEAGIDMCMVPNDYDFTKYLIELVKEGRIKESRLDISVARIMRLKKQLGLFANSKMPLIKDYPLFGSPQHKEVAKQTALESITLLQNKNNVLPLKDGQKILVTGPAANSMTMLNGAWTRTWQGVDTTWDDKGNFTIYQALINALPSNVVFSPGCDLEKMLNLEETLKLASQSDVIIACMGEKPSTEKPGDIDDLELAREQQQFVLELAKTGKPVVLVLVENRPRIVRDIVDACAAVVMLYEPGDQGGVALKDMLTGKVNPSGKLPFTYPRYNHSLIWYDHKYTETLDQQFSNNAFNPQWEFGFGMSYSELKYTSLNISSKTIHPGEKITVTVEVTNNSDREAKESVLMFVRDHYASVTPAVRKLKDFTKIAVAPHSSQRVSFSIDESMLQFIGRDMKPIIEEGDFDVMIGTMTSTFNYKLK